MTQTKFAFKPIDDIRAAWKYASVWLSGVAAIVAGAWAMLSPEQQAGVLAFIGFDNPGVVPAAAFIAILVSRLVQFRVPVEPPADPPAEG